MLFAPIAPVSMCEVVTGSSDYLMALPSMADADPGYADLYSNLGRNGAWVRLDNGVSEDKRPLAVYEFQAYIDLVGPSEIILPDYLGDAESTRAAAFVYSVRYQGAQRLMAVPQGKTLDEYVDCAFYFAGLPQIGTIGVSKYLPKYCGATRREFLERIRDAGLHNRTSLQWHLLGLAESLRELADLAMDFPWIRGIDTCYPVLASMMGKSIINDRTIVTSPKGFEHAGPYEYWPVKQQTETLWELLHDNLTHFALAARGRQFNGQ